MDQRAKTSDIDDCCDVLCIIEFFDVNFSRLDGHKQCTSHQYAYKSKNCATKNISGIGDSRASVELIACVNPSILQCITRKKKLCSYGRNGCSHKRDACKKISEFREYIFSDQYWY